MKGRACADGREKMQISMEGQAVAKYSSPNEKIMESKHIILVIIQTIYF